MDAFFASLPAPKLAVALGLATLIGLTLVQLVWGAALWGKKNEHRLEAGFGAEPIEVIEWSGESGLVRASGELWKAVSADALAPGDRVEAARADGLVLVVRKITRQEDQGE